MSTQSEPAEVAGISDQERLLVRTRRRAARLAVALMDAPFDEATVEALRSYLDHAEVARAAFEALAARPAQELRSRIDALVKATTSSGSGESNLVVDPRGPWLRGRS
jgi:hypothetical protein